MLKKLIALLLLPFSALALDDLAWDITKLSWVADGNGDYYGVWEEAFPAPFTWYKLDDTSDSSYDVVDSAGTATGTATAYPANMTVAGVNGAAFSFANAEYVTAPATGVDFTGAEPFSVTFWIKYDANGSNPMLFGTGSISSGGHGWTVMTYSEYIYLRLVGSENPASNALQARTDGVITEQLGSEVWHFITIAYDGSKSAAGVKFYVDGSPDNRYGVNDADALTEDISTGGALYIGNGNELTAQFYGILDDIRIYKSELTAAQSVEIYESYNYTPPPPVTIYFDATTLFPGDPGNVSLDYGSADYTSGQPFGSLPYTYDTTFMYYFNYWRDDQYNYYYDYTTVPSSSVTLYAEWY